MKKSRKQPTQTGVVSLNDEEHVQRVVADSILGLWDVVNGLTRLRPSRRDRYRVTIFGSARVPKKHWSYRAVRDLSTGLTRMDCDIVTGGGPGLMEAANEGARIGDPKGTRHSTGIRVQLPFEQDVNAFVTQAYHHRTFFTRLHHFVLVSDAFVVVPGGIGTVLETMMVWQLLQVRQLDNVPLILVGKMYAGLVDWCREHMLKKDCPLAGPDDMNIPRCVEDGPAILTLIKQHHAVWKKGQKKRR